MISTYNFGVDESYDPNSTGYFVLNFFGSDNEKNYAYLNDNVRLLCKRFEHTELKSNQLNLEQKKKVFSIFKSMDYLSFFFSRKLFSGWHLEDLYLSGIKSFAEELKQILPTYSQLLLNIDNIGGESFQMKCRSEIKKVFSNSKIKCTVKFSDSKRVEIVQIADILAGEYRKYLSNKSVFGKILLKSKCLT
jgi:hypothetical protein